MRVPFYNPTKVVFDSLENLPNYLDHYKTKRVLIFTGRGSMEKVVCRLRNSILTEYDIKVVAGNPPNPTTKTVDSAIAATLLHHPKLALALGGGSVIDVAKAATTLSANLGSAMDYMLGKRGISRRGIPLVAIPTTSGTGSEVTQYASIIVESTKSKVSLDHPHLFPHLAFIDPALAVSMPKQLTAITGMDALSQGIEAVWSRRANPMSDLFALEAIRLAITHLELAYRYPHDLEVRTAVARASLYSGFAISSTRTTAPHSVSYPLTVYFGIPHGLAVSLTLPAFMRYNAEEVPDRLQLITEALGECNIDDAIIRVERLIRNIGLPTRLREVGLHKKDLEVIVKHGFRLDRAANNPRPLTEQALKHILRSVY